MCTSESKWAFDVDIGIDPVTGKRQQKTKVVFQRKKKLKKLKP
ncbi:hypothetical protein CEQ21_04705 [Niallia circulans]|uniref:AP2-like integrase N-terminal domain-containing protein n=1 Tax=Niallia circulans TaxID=1397 RepID=A0A553STC9_NIACI|nr:Arm DNA-binding domain-containing protein [Niallia circulans]TRZ40242.1 hypothetical protein CEQ21_04705 [Niallia circulans]